MKVIVGSTALRIHGLTNREPKDVDVFSPDRVPGCDTFWDDRLSGWNWGDPVATPAELYTIKVSHAYWVLRNGSWNKHWFDILKMQEAGVEFLPELHDLLYPIWEDRYGKKRVNLELDPKDFFNGNVDRRYVHDSIHASVAYYDRPLFKEVLRDGSEVAVDWNKFLVLSLEDKLRLVREEVYATALERFIIPSDYTFNARAAYAKAFQKTVTSFWKGRWATWAVLHGLELNRPEIDYVAKHRDNAHLLIENEEQ